MGRCYGKVTSIIFWIDRGIGLEGAASQPLAPMYANDDKRLLLGGNALAVDGDQSTTRLHK